MFWPYLVRASLTNFFLFKIVASRFSVFLDIDLRGCDISNVSDMFTNNAICIFARLKFIWRRV